MIKLYGALLGLSFIWGTSFLFIKILLEDSAPTAVVFGRCLFGAAALGIIVLFKKKKLWNKGLPWKRIFIVALLNNAIPWYFISLSETGITSSLASIINATTPIWTLLIGTFLFSGRLRVNQWLGIAVGFIGIIILSDIKFGEFGTENTSGIVFMSFAAASYGMGTHMTKKYFADMPVIDLSFYTLSAATIVSFFVVMFTAPESAISLAEWENFFPLLGLGAFGSGIAYLLFYFLVKEGGPEFASLVTYLVPITAVLWGAVILKEEINASMIWGLFIIFSGVYISTRKQNSKNKTKAAA